MPTVTQDRPSPGHSDADNANVWNDGFSIRSYPTFIDGTSVPSYSLCRRPRQVTTSYRTGRGAPDGHTPTPGELFKNAKSEAIGTGDTGHPFNTVRTVVSTRVGTIDSTGSSSFRAQRYVGALFSNRAKQSIVGTASPIPSVPNSTDLVQLGTRAINATIPTNPTASLATALGEIAREGLPNLIGAATLRGRGGIDKKLADEHLNYQFGWKPVVNDVVKTATALAHLENRIDQLVRDSGRTVRRKFTFPDETISSSTWTGEDYLQNPTQSPGWYDAFSGLGGTHVGTTTDTITTTRRVWFSGAYTYHYDPSGSLPGQFGKFQEKYLRSLGLELSPSVVWNLMPWSWLSDWTNNFGVVLENAESFSRDGLVLRYGYVMSQTVTTRTCTLNGVRRRGGASFGPVTTTFVTTLPARVQATPYGFGRTPGSFTNRQWSILAALGISRGNRQLSLGG